MFWSFLSHKKTSVKPQNFMFLTLLKLKKKRKRGGGGMKLFEPYFANLSFSPGLRKLVPSCNSPHIFTSWIINLCKQMQTFAFHRTAWAPVPGQEEASLGSPPNVSPSTLATKFESVLWPHMLTGTARKSQFLHSLKTWKFGELARAAPWDIS